MVEVYKLFDIERICSLFILIIVERMTSSKIKLQLFEEDHLREENAREPVDFSPY